VVVAGTLCDTSLVISMMRASRPPQHHDRLLPEGRRWGFGAHSLVPYLTMTLNARPGNEDDMVGSIRNPVFPSMADALRALRQGH
jgi:hypothetical protein